MKKSMLPTIVFLAATMGVGSIGIATEALARGGHDGGGHSLGAGELGGAGEVAIPGVTSPTLEPNTPEGRSAAGFNFNNQLRNGATVPQNDSGMDGQPQPGAIDGQQDTNSNGETGTDAMP